MSCDLNIIAKRLVDGFVQSGEHEGAAAAYVAQRPDGSFPDIDYSNDSMSSWEPSKHLPRLREMAVAYKRICGGNGGDGGGANGADMLAAVIKGLEFWFARKPVSLNWWHNQIGKQLQLGPIALMLKDDLPGILIDACADALLDPAKVGPTFTTGQNLVWFATESIYRGLIKEDEGDVADGVSYILREITIGQREGIQTDYSFHQHGPQLYNGGYGLGFVRDTAHFAHMLRGTAYAFPSEKLDMIVGLLLEGDRWMVYSHWMDYCVQGREIARVGCDKKAISLIPVCDMLEQLEPSRAAEILGLKSMISGKSRSCVIGNRYFHHSDYMSHRDAGFASSVRMASSRLFGTESMNRENRKGCWLPFGVHFTLVRGDEYDGIVPLFNWTQLPGVTAPQMLYEMPVFVNTDVEFVGGVSDGTFGAAAMQLDKLDVRAKKSVVFLWRRNSVPGSGH